MALPILNILTTTNYKGEGAKSGKAQTRPGPMQGAHR